MTEARADDLPMYNPLGRHAIRVNAVAPGIIDTPMVRGGFAQQSNALVEGAPVPMPLGRLGKPEDVAAVIAFLLSVGAAFVTGGIETLSPISPIAKGA